MLLYLSHVVRERLYKEERGQSFIEYSLLVALIALAVIGAVTFGNLGGAIADVFSSVMREIRNVVPGAGGGGGGGG